MFLGFTVSFGQFLGKHFESGKAQFLGPIAQAQYIGPNSPKNHANVLSRLYGLFRELLGKFFDLGKAQIFGVYCALFVELGLIVLKIMRFFWGDK